MIQITNVGDNANNVVITIEAPLSAEEKELVKKAKALEVKQSASTSNPIGKGGIRWGAKYKNSDNAQPKQEKPKRKFGQKSKPASDDGFAKSLTTNADGTVDLSEFETILDLDEFPDFDSPSAAKPASKSASKPASEELDFEAILNDDQLPF